MEFNLAAFLTDPRRAADEEACTGMSEKTSKPHIWNKHAFAKTRHPSAIIDLCLQVFNEHSREEKDRTGDGGLQCCFNVIPVASPPPICN